MVDDPQAVHPVCLFRFCRRQHSFADLAPLQREGDGNRTSFGRDLPVDELAGRPWPATPCFHGACPLFLKVAVRNLIASHDTASAALTSLKVVIAQHLVPTPDLSGRFAIREFMVFTDDVQDRYISQPVENWTKVTRDLFKEARTNTNIVAQSLKRSIEIKMQAGLLTVDCR